MITILEAFKVALNNPDAIGFRLWSSTRIFEIFKNKEYSEAANKLYKEKNILAHENYCYYTEDYEVLEDGVRIFNSFFPTDKIIRLTVLHLNDLDKIKDL
jgi:hypothetical protein